MSLYDFVVNSTATRLAGAAVEAGMDAATRKKHKPTEYTDKLGNTIITSAEYVKKLPAEKLDKWVRDTYVGNRVQRWSASKFCSKPGEPMTWLDSIT